MIIYLTLLLPVILLDSNFYILNGGDEVSHSVKVTIIADQEIEINGKIVNIHDIKTLVLDSFGKIKEVTT